MEITIEQVIAMEKELKKNKALSVTIESTNLENTICCSIGSKKILVDIHGNTFTLLHG